MTFRAFQPGDRVEWQDSVGNWHPGKIALVRDGMASTSYDAELDDGSTVADYSAGRFRKINPAPPTSGPDSFVMVESAVRSLPSGYAFADAVEHATPADESGALNALADDEAERQQYERDKLDPSNCLTTPAAEPRAAAQEGSEEWRGFWAQYAKDYEAKHGHPPPSGAGEDAARYEELIYAVARKFPGESRHDTALRYIREREAAANEGGAARRARGESA